MMNKGNFRILGIFALLVISLFSINFVLATTATATNLVFDKNVTSTYDEGNFSVNWTAGGDVAGNYTVYIFNGVAFAKTINNSVTGYSFSNFTEANYTFIIGAVNKSTAVETNSTTNISIYVDRTPPVIALPIYTNATAMKNSSQLTLNVSVSDAQSGLTGSVCLANINGTNQSFAVSAGWCNFTQGNLTGLTDGINKIQIYVNDTVNILGLNNTFWVWTDTTAPTASPSCSPSTISAGDSFPCSCSGTDSATNNTGLNSSLTSGSSSSPDGTSTPIGLGPFTYTCSVTDLAGNSASLSATYTVQGSSGLTSTGTTPTTAVVTSIVNSQIFSEISPGTASTMTNFDVSTAIKEIQINVNNEAQNVLVTVTGYSAKPASVSVDKSGKVFQYLQIKMDNVAGKLDKATVITKVNKSWVSDNNLDKSNLSLFKFNETSNAWMELPTIYSSEDSNYYYYTTNLTSFSYFAIGEKSLVNSNGTTAGTTSATTNLTWLWIVIGIVVLAAVAFVLIRKKK